jgi:hypothetical protein
VFAAFPGRQAIRPSIVHPRRTRQGGLCQMFSRFCRYLDKVFDFSGSISTLRDCRLKPQIPTVPIWLSAFVMCATRRGSLNAMETSLRIPKRLDKLIGPRKPSADTVGRTFCLMDPAPLRTMLCRMDLRLGRNKALYNDWPLRMVAIDGHEFFSQSTSSLPAVPAA